MRKFTEEEVERYERFNGELVGSMEELAGICFVCGEPLSELELPEGPEKKIVCLKDREFLVEGFEEAEKQGDI